MTALIALVEYAKRDTNRALYNIEVIVQATSMGNYSESVRLVAGENWADLQEVEVGTRVVIEAFDSRVTALC